MPESKIELISQEDSRQSDNDTISAVTSILVGNPDCSPNHSKLLIIASRIEWPWFRPQILLAHGTSTVLPQPRH